MSVQFVFSWKDAEWLCSEWKGPRAIKVSWTQDKNQEWVGPIPEPISRSVGPNTKTKNELSQYQKPKPRSVEPWNKNNLKNSAKRDTRPLKGMFNSPIYVHLGGEPKKKIFGRRSGKKFGRDWCSDLKSAIFPIFHFSLSHFSF